MTKEKSKALLKLLGVLETVLAAYAVTSAGDVATAVGTTELNIVNGCRNILRLKKQTAPELIAGTNARVSKYPTA